MQLEQTNIKSIKHGIIKEIKKGVLYYVYTGRNAWHSTWITRYSIGCMHTTMDSAQLYAETKRKSGTVVYIQKLPCLYLKDKEKSVIITEINSTNPLHGYNPYHTNNIKKNKDPSVMKPEIGKLLAETVLSFHPVSSFWIKNPSFENSIIALSADSSVILEELKATRLDTYKSVSFGSDAYLYWDKIDPCVKGSAVSSIYRKLIKINPEHP